MLQCPSTVEEELDYNPFLRTCKESVLKSLGMVEGGQGLEFGIPSDDIRAQALGEMRERKDAYKYIQ